jgi:hypothetical protein
MIYGAGTIASLGSTKPQGTWNLTFNPDGQISLVEPNGGVTNFALPPDAVTKFSGSVYAYFGIQPNQLTSLGQSATLSHLQITGVSTPIDEPFANPALDTSLWEIVAEDPTGAVVVPPDAKYFINWTLPDTGYATEVTFDLDSGGWFSLPVTSSQIAGLRRGLLLQSLLPASDTGNYFFRLTKP